MWLININYSIIATASESSHSEGSPSSFLGIFDVNIPLLSTLLLVCQFVLP